jgi:2''-aminoglycoside nucleotidyltransferase
VSTEPQVRLIHDLVRAADAIDLPLWLESGWAVDARLGRVTREHGDIDLAIPAERMADFHGLLRHRSAGPVENTDYGFLVRVDGVLLDCKPCVLVNGSYELEGGFRGSCPPGKEGIIEGVRVRCTSWSAILQEYFHYLQEVTYADWPAKDKESYRAVRAAVGDSRAEALHAEFSR